MGDWDRIPGIGKSSAVALDAFKLTTEQPLSQEVYDVEGAKVLIRLKERSAPDADAAKVAERASQLYFEARNKRLGQLAQGSQSLFLIPTDSYGPWLDNLYAQAVKSGRVVFMDRVDMAKILSDDSPLKNASADASKAIEPTSETSTTK